MKTLWAVLLGSWLAWSAPVMAIDSCATAQDITSSLPFSDSFSNAAFANSSGLPSGNGYGTTFSTTLIKAAWYVITPTDDTFLRIDLNGSSMDTVIQVYSGSCAGLTPVALNEDRAINNDTSVLEVELTGGTTYYIAAASVFASGTLAIAIEQSEYPLFLQVNPVVSQNDLISINVPGSPQKPNDGDLIFVWLSHKGADWATPPSGFALIDHEISGAVRGELFVKTASGDNLLSTYAFDIPGSNTHAITGFAFATRHGTVDAFSVRANGSGSSGSASITTVKDFSWIFSFMAGESGTNGASYSAPLIGATSMEEVEDSVTFTHTDASLGFAAVRVAGAGVATGAAAWTNAGTVGNNVGFLLAVGRDADFEPNLADIPQDYSTPCCGDDAGPGQSAGSASVVGGDPTGPTQGWTVQCDGGGTVPSESDPSASEVWG